MIKNELRIGNYVNRKDSNGVSITCYQIKFGYEIDNNVSLIDKHYYLNYTNEGIPLTEEWLLKFGFDKATELFEFPDGHEIHTGFGILIDEFTYLVLGDAQTENISLCDKEDFHTILLSVTIKYVHSLQNLYFSLTGKELILTTKTESDNQPTGLG